MLKLERMFYAVEGDIDSSIFVLNILPANDGEEERLVEYTARELE